MRWLLTLLVAVAGLVLAEGIRAQDAASPTSTAPTDAAVTGAAAGKEAPAGTPERVKPVYLQDRVSYAFGVNLVGVARQNDIWLNEDFFIAGVQDALYGRETLLTPEEMQAAIQQHGEYHAKKQEERDALAEANRKAGEEFLTKNKERDGVIALPSGLQYEILTKGSGEVPKGTDSVRVQYRGSFIDGTAFDSTYEREKPAVLPVERMLPGWNEAIQMMPVGSRWKLYIPGNLAYGPTGKGGIIGPDSTVIFEIELLGIEPAAGAGS